MKRWTAHGGSYSRTYTSWKKMLQRCENPRDKRYPEWGGRGIKVCDRWHDYAAFLSDMGERPAGMSIERENNDGDYEPGNCRWASAADQVRNRRNTRMVTIDGVTLCLKDWARQRGINYQTVYMRIARGKSALEALEL